MVSQNLQQPQLDDLCFELTSLKNQVQLQHLEVTLRLRNGK